MPQLIYIYLLFLYLFSVLKVEKNHRILLLKQLKQHQWHFSCHQIWCQVTFIFYSASISRYKGLLVEITILIWFNEHAFGIANSAVPNEMPHLAVSHLGLHCLLLSSL